MITIMMVVREMAKAGLFEMFGSNFQRGIVDKKNYYVEEEAEENDRVDVVEEDVEEIEREVIAVEVVVEEVVEEMELGNSVVEKYVVEEDVEKNEREEVVAEEYERELDVVE
jgi:hypothetical protein